MVSWRSSADQLDQAIHAGCGDAGLGTDIEAAWSVFGEFTQTEFAGVDTEADSDGVIVQWGRYRWNGFRPSLTFTRQLATVGELWQINLELRFDDHVGLAGLDGLPRHDTGWTFAPIGPLRSAALVDLRAVAERHSPVRQAWQLRAVSRTITLDRAD
ncbi:hypothetical protein [Cryptosporangium japonicum]|uniref:SnoaL-like domain-containing protein n=1 Tax=Cryptosporangium japonicum TaxID=80872 RepID=A0ABN0UE42_9ACTN